MGKRIGHSCAYSKRRTGGRRKRGTSSTNTTTKKHGEDPANRTLATVLRTGIIKQNLRASVVEGAHAQIGKGTKRGWKQTRGPLERRERKKKKRTGTPENGIIFRKARFE